MATSFTEGASMAQTRSLDDMIRQRASRKDIASYLDGLGPSERVAQVGAVRGAQVGKLYEAVAGGEPLGLEDFVPQAEGGTVIFQGRNSLPAFSSFQKRFARKGDTVFGYNHQTVSFVTGPGYFVVRPPTPGEPHPGELFFDYTTPPPGEPAGWPAYRPNSSGLSRAVFMNMKDYCRRIAKGVLVGKAYKLGVPQNAYFTLTSPY